MSPTHQDASKILLGSVGDSDRLITCEDADPASFVAGRAVRRESGGGLSLTSGRLIGVSLGASLSDHKKTAVCRTGNRVPLALKDEGEYATLTKGDLTFTAKEKGTAGNSIQVTLAGGGLQGSPEVNVTGTSILIIDEESTAQEIKDAIDNDEEASALISVEIAEGEEASAQTAFTIDNLEGGLDSYPYAVVGDPVLVDATTGEASSDGSATGAVYESEALDGISSADGSVAYKVAQVDMPGGL